MAFSGTQTTRHGLYGGARGLYGSFVGKTIPVVVVPDAMGFEFTLPRQSGGFTIPANRAEFTIPVNAADFTL